MLPLLQQKHRQLHAACSRAELCLRATCHGYEAYLDDAVKLQRVCPWLRLEDHGDILDPAPAVTVPLPDMDRVTGELARHHSFALIDFHEGRFVPLVYVHRSGAREITKPVNGSDWM